MEHIAGGQVRIRMSDLREARAYIELSPEAKANLCQKAGAPWAEKNPEAKLSPLMKEVLSRRERIQILNGGSGLGKSTLGGMVSLCELMVPNTRTAVVGSRYEFVSAEYQYLVKGVRVLFGDKQHAFQRLVFKNQANYHEYMAITAWNSSAIGYSVDQDSGEVLLGKEFSLVVAGEGSRIPIETFDSKIRRALDRSLTNNLLGQELGKMICFSTPDGYTGMSSDIWDRCEKQTKGKLELLHYGATDFRSSVWLREANALENPAYDKAAYEAAKASIDPAAFQEQYEGKRVHTSGRIYREFRNSHIIEMPTASEIQKMRLGLGIDTGSFFAASLAGIDREGFVRILGEVKTKQAHIRDSCHQVRSMVETVLGRAFDEMSFDQLLERLDILTIDPASQHKIEVSEYLSDAALELPGRSQGKFELLPTIDKVRELVEDGKLLIVEDCQETYEELKKYIWKRTKVGNQGGGMLAIREPLKVNDHLMDAMRFIVVPLLEAGPLSEVETQPTMVQAFGNQAKSGVFGYLREMMQRGEDKGGIDC